MKNDTNINNLIENYNISDFNNVIIRCNDINHNYNVKKWILFRHKTIVITDLESLFDEFIKKLNKCKYKKYWKFKTFNLESKIKITYLYSSYGEKIYIELLSNSNNNYNNNYLLFLKKFAQIRYLIKYKIKFMSNIYFKQIDDLIDENIYYNKSKKNITLIDYLIKPNKKNLYDILIKNDIF